MKTRPVSMLMALLAALITVIPVRGAPAIAADPVTKAYRDIAKRIIEEANSEGTANEAWNRLAELSDTYPARLSGSASLDAAIGWSAEKMRRDGFANVRIDPVMVPHWVRGNESAAIIGPLPLQPRPLTITALGGSVGTGARPLEAEVLVVKSFDDLQARAAEAKGRVVVYNVGFDENIEPLEAYQRAARYRSAGASRAAALGAIAVLVRSVGPLGFRTPHTGMTRYTDGTPQIPIAAISAEDTETLQRMVDRGQRPVVRVFLGAEMLPDTPSGNVIAELPGREHPEQIILLAAHIDSWDLASGAMDDAAGCIAIWEALRVLKRLGLHPRRTIRIVLFTNEENGARGATAYRDRYRDQLANHVLAMETDNGMLPIRGYGFVGAPADRPTIASIIALLAPVGGTKLDDRLDGADIAPTVKAGNVPALSLDIDLRRYFAIHHTPADTVDKVDPSEMAKVIAAMATAAFIVADMPRPLARSPH